MDYKKLGLGLGAFSIGLGLLEVAAPGRLARWLGVEGKPAKTVLRWFGGRELLAGAMLARSGRVDERMEPSCRRCDGFSALSASPSPAATGRAR